MGILSQMSRTVTNVTRQGGNTKPPVAIRRACFTLNNWTDEELSQCHKDFDGCQYIIGKEVGEEGTPHLQGYVEFKKQIRWNTLVNLNPRIHWEKARGDRKQNIAYCSKEGDFKSTFPKSRKEQLLEEYDDVVWRPWQQEIIDLVKTKPCSRTIHWYWETTGNKGKSFLSKYLWLKYDAIIMQGQTLNIAHQIKTWLDEHDEDVWPTIALMDIPRCTKEYINYQAIEKIKDTMIVSGKYEGGICGFKHLHAICFANEPPTFEKMSQDRWVVHEM